MKVTGKTPDRVKNIHKGSQDSCTCHFDDSQFAKRWYLVAFSWSAPSMEVRLQSPSPRFLSECVQGRESGWVRNGRSNVSPTGAIRTRRTWPKKMIRRKMMM